MICDKTCLKDLVLSEIIRTFAKKLMMSKDIGEDSYSHILKYTGIFGGVQGLNILISLVRNKAVALLLGPSGMGLASLFRLRSTSYHKPPIWAFRSVLSEMFRNCSIMVMRCLSTILLR